MKARAMSCLCGRRMIDRAAIRKAIERLPIPDDRRFKIDAIEENLVSACGPMFGSLDTANSYEVGKVRAADALGQFAASAKKLAAQLRALPAEAAVVLRLAIDAEQEQRTNLMHPAVRDTLSGTVLFWMNALNSPDNFAQKLERFAQCAEEGIPVIAEIAEENVPRGARQKHRALAITRIAAWAYEDLTGKPPTRHTHVKPINAHTQGSQPGGPFIEFLGSIFTGAGIAASPEAQAKAVLMEKKGTR
ncbi:hypothetical protein AJ88_26170 [Mesorhizobium amorphae CCBAU 01583]|nr:hypothetical protein AJ88_26170 [Mesorhizobium amorphae CCBAU 01583]